MSELEYYPECAEKTAAVQEVLETARETYGNKNQILVCMEELNELACVLAKYPRYADENKATEELYDKVLDEVADVTIILEHVKSIFGIRQGELNMRLLAKVQRLNRWLHDSKSMQQTIDDRKVEPIRKKRIGGFCRKCRLNCDDETMYVQYCIDCLKAQATDGIAIHFKDIFKG